MKIYDIKLFPAKNWRFKDLLYVFYLQSYKDKDKIAIFEHCDGCLPLKVVEAIG